MRLAWLRAVQAGGMMFASLALGGYLLLSSPPASALAGERNAGDLTVLLVGRDVSYCAPHTPCEDQDSEQSRRSANTDTLMLVRFSPQRVEVVSIPRDTQVGEFDPGRRHGLQKINNQYAQGGPAQLLAAVGELMNEPVRYYAVVQVAAAGRIIDALGGLDVTAPRDVDFTDNAAGVRLQLPAGQHHLRGEDAVTYLRLRRGFGDDYGRIDNQKLALIQLGERLQSPQGLRALPTLLSELSRMETNLDPAFVQRALRARPPQLTFSTLPVEEMPGTSNLRPLAAPPAALADLAGLRLEVVDASGVPGLGAAVAGALEGFGLPASLSEAPVRSSSAVSTVTRPAEAEALADLLALPKLQGLRQPAPYSGVAVILGRDAAQHFSYLFRMQRNP